MESKKTERFSWIDDSSIVVRHYGSIALFKNEFGDLVIRQEKQEDYQDEDFTKYLWMHPSQINTECFKNFEDG